MKNWLSTLTNSQRIYILGFLVQYKFNLGGRKIPRPLVDNDVFLIKLVVTIITVDDVVFLINSSQSFHLQWRLPSSWWRLCRTSFWNTSPCGMRRSSSPTSTPPPRIWRRWRSLAHRAAWGRPLGGPSWSRLCDPLEVSSWRSGTRGSWLGRTVAPRIASGHRATNGECWKRLKIKFENGECWKRSRLKRI